MPQPQIHSIPANITPAVYASKSFRGNYYHYPQQLQVANAAPLLTCADLLVWIPCPVGMNSYKGIAINGSVRRTSSISGSYFLTRVRQAFLRLREALHGVSDAVLTKDITKADATNLCCVQRICTNDSDASIGQPSAGRRS